jgi:flagellar motor switch protein FliN/FliY
MSFLVDPATSVTGEKIGLNGSDKLAMNAHPLDLGEISPNAELPGSHRHPKLLAGLNPLRKVKTTVQVCVGRATVSVGDLLDAKDQQVLVLDRLLSEPVDLLLEGNLIARGQLVAVGSQFAIRLTELPEHLDAGGKESYEHS